MLDNAYSLIVKSGKSSELTFENFLDIVLMIDTQYPDFY
jgi:hypothetical protein